MVTLRRGVRLAAALVFGVSLLLPFAGAEAVEGVLQASSVEATGTATLATTPAAAYFPPDAPWRTFTAHASELKVTIHEHQRLELGPLRPYAQNFTRSYLVHDASVRIDQTARGWIGFYPAPDATWTLHGAGVLGLAPQPGGVVGQSDQPGGVGPYEPILAFAVDVGQPHLELRVGTASKGEGGLLLKTHDSTVRIEGRENTTTIVTGTFEGNVGLDAEQIVRWVTLEATSAEHTLPAAAGGIIASRDVAGTIDGELVIRDAEGDLASAAGPYILSGREDRVRGRLGLDATTSGADRLLLALGGDVASASGVRAPVSPSSGGYAALLVVGLFSATAAGAAAFAAARRRHDRVPALSVDQYVQLASEAAEAGDAAAALEWTAQALRIAPASARLHTDRGYYLEQLDDLDGALEAYDRAAALEPHGEALFLAAIMLTLRKGELVQAERRLIEALRRTPSIALEAEDDAALSALVQRRPVREALRAAHRALDRDEAH